MGKGSFVFYETFLETANKLEEMDKGLAYEYMKAIANYGLYGEVYEGNPVIETLMVQSGTNIDIAKDRYQKSIENGRKGGRPRKVDWSEMYRLMREGKTDKEIAETLNCTADYVRKKRKEKDAFKQKNQTYLNENDNDNGNVNINVNGNENDKEFLPSAKISW